MHATRPPVPGQECRTSAARSSASTPEGATPARNPPSTPHKRGEEWREHAQGGRSLREAREPAAPRAPRSA
eukprot:292864-Alexandrium_andersonii.AAC.1